MTETNKNANRSFLDKFEGRTNKVGKLGVQAALIGGKDNEHDNPDQFRKVDLDVLIPSNPEKHSMKLHTDNIVKRRESLGKPPLKSPQQKDYVPSAYTPQTTSKDDTLSSNHPPSRSLSNSTNNSRGKYIFGKYLKLDK